MSLRKQKLINKPVDYTECLNRTIYRQEKKVDKYSIRKDADGSILLFIGDILITAFCIFSLLYVLLYVL